MGVIIINAVPLNFDAFCILSSRHYHICRHDNGCESRRCLLLFGPSSKAHSAIAPMLPFHQSAALCDSNQKPTLLSHRFEALFICCTYNTLLKVICQLFFQICYHALREGIMSYFIPAGACRGHLPVSS